MKKKNLMLGGAVGLLSLATIGTASAHMGGNSEARAAVKAALENKSYTEFQTATADKKIAETIDSQEKFNKLIEAHELRASGDREGAKAIRDELGLKGKHGKGARNPEARAAVEAGDYAAFQTATADKKFAEKIDSQEKFNKLVEAHELRESGDHEGAQAIRDELGLKGKGGHGHGNKGAQK